MVLQWREHRHQRNVLTHETLVILWLVIANVVIAGLSLSLCGGRLFPFLGQS